MQEILLFATVILPIVLGLVELVKKVADFPKNYIPLVALVVGLFVGFAAVPFTDLPLDVRLWSGALAGLSATGLFELVTKTDGTTKGGDYK